ncbi:MAG: hypothetical protein ACN6PY_08260 [Paraburkholderia nemoris]
MNQLNYGVVPCAILIEARHGACKTHRRTERNGAGITKAPASHPACRHRVRAGRHIPQI